LLLLLLHQATTVRGAPFSAGDVACVIRTGGEGLRVHAAPSLSATVVCDALPSDAFTVADGPSDAENYTWWKLRNVHCEGWAVDDFLSVCGGNSSRWNRFGLGLVSSGDASMTSYVSNLAGSGGWILLVFPGVTNTSGAPPSDWVAAVSAAYAAKLRPVVRIGPPWGDTFYRDMSDYGECVVCAGGQMRQAEYAVNSRILTGPQSALFAKAST
jgi:hypothetical protein